MKISIKNTCIALSALVAANLFSSCADMFQGKIGMNTTSTIATLADIVTETKSIDTLACPSQLFVSEGDDATSITVSWTSVPEALSYRLERAVVTTRNIAGGFDEPSEGDFQIINGTFGNTAFIYGRTYYVDTILTNPKSTAPEYGYKYFYRISAENNTQSYGASEFTKPKGGNLFAPPTSVTATTGSYKDRIIVSWKKSTSVSATGYTVYRSPNADGTNSTRLATIKSNMTQYVDYIAEDSRGTEYYYTVCAENSIGNSSIQSSIAMGYARTDGAPTQVTDLKVTKGRAYDKESITISWTGDPDTFYSVYRSNSKDSALTMLTSSLTNSTNYTYSDTNSLSENLYYYYMVQPWKYGPDGTTQVKGQMSDTSMNSPSPAEGFILSSPQSIYVTKNRGYHTISWTKALGAQTEQENYSYIILGSSAPDTGFTPVATVEAKNLTSINNEYSYALTSPNSYYRIQTKNGDNLSMESQTVAPAPYAPKNLSVSRYANLSSEMGAKWICNANEVYPVRLSWTAPDEPSDVAGYYIYRSDKKDSGYKKLSVDNDEKTYLVTGTIFYDQNTGARPKKVYYYKVVSVNSLGDGTNYTDAEFGYGAITANQYMREYNITVLNSQKKLTLMHKSGNTNKLGKESADGTLSGSLYYNAGISGVSGRVIMEYTNYSDFYVHSNGKIDSVPLSGDDDIIGTADGIYFNITGNTNTSAGIDTNGSMDGTVTCSGMYPGSVNYDSIQIKSGAAGGGVYIIKRENFEAESVNWSVANEK